MKGRCPWKKARENVIALGFFDGVHLGHQALLRRAEERGDGVGDDPGGLYL